MPVPPATPAVEGGHVEARRGGYEATHTPADWGATKVWLATHYDYLVWWLTSGTFSDGTYRLRFVGWDEAGGALQNPRVLPVCGTQNPAEGRSTTSRRIRRRVRSTIRAARARRRRAPTSR